MEQAFWYYHVLDEKNIHYAFKSPGQEGLAIDDLGLRALLGLDGQGLFLSSQELTEDILSSSEICLLSDSLLCRYILMKGPEGGLLIIGPYLTGNYSPAEIKKHLGRQGIAPSVWQPVYQHYASLPQIGDPQMWEALLQAFVRASFGIEKLKIESRLLTEMKKEGSRAPYITDENVLIHEIEKRYDLESSFMAALALGDAKSASRTLQKMSRPSVEKRTGNMIRDIKNMLVVFNTLCRTAVKESGIHPKIIDRLSREFSLRIESASDPAMLRGLRIEMVERYCQAVRESVYADNPTVRRVLVYIQENLDKPLSLQETAGLFCLSRGYLEKAFKEETGKSFMDYVHALRLKKACALLERTDLHIGQVAALCGYLDSNYFSRKFRSVFGKAPGDYRRSKKDRSQGDP